MSPGECFWASPWWVKAIIIGVALAGGLIAARQRRR